MKWTSSNYIVCPACLGTLVLSPPPTLCENTIDDARLVCESCKRQYDISSGLPLLMLKDAFWQETQMEMIGEKELVQELPVSEHIKRNRFESQRSWEFLRRMKIPPHPAILDIGGSSGIGSFLFRPFDAHVTIIDIVPDLLKLASECLGDQLDLETMIACMEWLPFSNDYFDVVFCRQAIHHSLEPSRAFREMFRVTKPNGLVMVISEPCFSIMDKIKLFLGHSNKDLLSTNSEILKKLPDEKFHYGWQDYRRDLRCFTDRFIIERATGSAATIATENGLRFEPFAVKRGPIGKFLNAVLPGGRGHRGEVNIWAEKRKSIFREDDNPDFAPVSSDDFEIKEVSPEEKAEYRSVFAQFFNELDEHSMYLLKD